MGSRLRKRENQFLALKGLTQDILIQAMGASLAYKKIAGKQEAKRLSFFAPDHNGLLQQGNFF